MSLTLILYVQYSSIILIEMQERIIGKQLIPHKVNVTWNMIKQTVYWSDLQTRSYYLFWCNDTWTIGPNKARFGLFHQKLLHLYHIMLWNTFCDTYYQWHFSLNSFNNSVCCARGWNINNSGICSCCIFCLDT